ncbi:MAG: hypothetical protein HFG49_01315 [Lachnospiraceae bacterium]|jgi:ribosomal protein L14E/L6E/L27E|nr:hypothetical protein [Lachnospiraceae bacterium]
MKELEPGCLARSLAGHDKGRLYIIIKADGEYVSLTDGKTRTVGWPKRKKKKHVQLQDPKDQALKHKLKQEKTVTDEEVRRFLDSQKQFSQQGGMKRNVESRCN